MKTEINPTDRTILNLLQKDARLTTKEIASHLGLSTTPTYERIKRLEKNKYIKSYVALLDRKKLGKNLMTFCSVAVKEHSQSYLQRFEREIFALEEVIECYHIAGRFDFLLKVITANMDDYHHFVTHRLSQIAHIQTVQSDFVMSEVKQSTQLPI